MEDLQKPLLTSEKASDVDLSPQAIQHKFTEHGADTINASSPYAATFGHPRAGDIVTAAHLMAFEFTGMPFDEAVAQNIIIPAPVVQWCLRDGLPDVEGKGLSCDTSGAWTLQDIRRRCESLDDCVGFAYWPAKGRWYPKRRDTGFDESTATYSQKRSGETWEWHYIRSRAQARTVSSNLDSPRSSALSVSQESAVMQIQQLPDDFSAAARSRIRAFPLGQAMPTNGQGGGEVLLGPMHRQTSDPNQWIVNDEDDEDGLIINHSTDVKLTRIISRLAEDAAVPMDHVATDSSETPTSADVADEPLVRDLRELLAYTNHSRPSFSSRLKGISEMATLSEGTDQYSVGEHADDLNESPPIDNSEEDGPFRSRVGSTHSPRARLTQGSQLSMWSGMDASVVDERGSSRPRPSERSELRSSWSGMDAAVYAERHDSDIVLENEAGSPSQFQRSKASVPVKPVELRESLDARVSSIESSEVSGRPVALRGFIWRRKPNISKSGKLLRSLRQEAQAILSLKTIRPDQIGNRIKQVAKEVLWTQQRPASIDDQDDDDHESVWMLRQVRLVESKLSWMSAKREAMTDAPPSGSEGALEEDFAEGKFTQTGPLWGSTVEPMGLHKGKLHAFQVFVPHQAWRREPLIFATDTQAEADRWVNALKAAAAFPLPKPALARPCCDRVADCFKARGPPPEYEPPPSNLDLLIISLDLDMRVKQGGRGVYVIGRVNQHEFRTSTSYDSELFQFGQRFHFPVELDGADEVMHFQAFVEPEYSDREPCCLGGITLPLFTLGRNQLVELVLPLRQPKLRGTVNDSFGDLVIQLTFNQPLGHLFLPVEPPVNSLESKAKEDKIDMVDVEMQLARVDALLQLYLNFVNAVAVTCQWEFMFHSMMWFVFLQVWVLFAWKWSMPILVALALYSTLRQRFRRDLDESEMQLSSTSDKRVSSLPSEPSPHSDKKIVKRLSFRVEPEADLESGPGSAIGSMSSLDSESSVITHTKSGDGKRIRRKTSQRWPNSDSLKTNADKQKDSEELKRKPRTTTVMKATSTMKSRIKTEKFETPPHIVLWEAERRVIFAGFSSEYLHDFDPPMWADGDGNECDGPAFFGFSEDGERYRFKWAVVVDEDTDENGWQYAFRFDSEEWFKSFDPMYAWVRRRKRHGWRLQKLQKGESKLLPDDAHQALALGLDSADLKVHGQVHAQLPQGGAGTNVESMLTDVGQFRRYFQLYSAVRADVVDLLLLVEKHKNLFTWKDRAVSQIISAVLATLLVLVLWLPTSIVFSLLICLAFYIGLLLGNDKRRLRSIFLEALSEWCSEVCGETLHLKGSESLTVLDDKGFAHIAVRNWCNSRYDVSLDLRTLNGCERLGELADLVVRASPKIEKVSRRYRAWHSDFYGNFLDHVPSDMSKHDIDSCCYRPPAATSLVAIPT